MSHRRQRVAYYRLRGFSQRAIEKALAEEGAINEKQNKPWSLGVINKDIQALDEIWKSEAAKDTNEHQGRILAELKEVVRVAWESDDLRVILKSLAQQVDLLGLDTSRQLDLDINFPDIDDWKAGQPGREKQAAKTMAIFDDDNKAS